MCVGIVVYTSLLSVFPVISDPNWSSKMTAFPMFGSAVVFTSFFFTGSHQSQDLMSCLLLPRYLGRCHQPSGHQSWHCSSQNSSVPLIVDCTCSRIIISFHLVSVISNPARTQLQRILHLCPPADQSKEKCWCWLGGTFSLTILNLKCTFKKVMYTFCHSVT